MYLAKVKMAKVATKAKTLAKIDQCYEAQLRESKNTPFYAWPLFGQNPIFNILPLLESTINL